MAIETIKRESQWMTATPGKVYDGGNLILVVKSATSAVWVYRFRYGGKPDQVNLGPRAKITLTQARDLRRWCEAELLAGRNPRESRQNEKLERVRAVNAPKAMTVYELAEAHVSVIAKKLKTEKGRDEWVRSLHKDRIGYIADMDPAAVTLADVKPMLEDYYKRAPVMAKDVRERLCRVLAWAYNDDRIPTPGWQNPAAWDLLKDKLAEQGQDHEEEHHAALAHDEVGLFLAGLRGVNDRMPSLKLALEWDVISATRANETAYADWCEIDWDADCWVIPARRMKMRRPHRVPLTDRHHAILNLLMPVGATEAPRSGPLFPGRNDGDTVSITGMRKLMQAIRKPGGAEFIATKEMSSDEDEGITLHGFRTSFRTWAQSEAYPVKLPNGETRRIEIYSDVLIEECLAHKVGGDVRNAYIGKGGDTMERRRDILNAWSRYCAVVQSEKVVQLPRRPRAAAA